MIQQRCCVGLRPCLWRNTSILKSSEYFKHSQYTATPPGCQSTPNDERTTYGLSLTWRFWSKESQVSRKQPQISGCLPWVPLNTSSTPYLSLHLQLWPCTWVQKVLWMHLADIRCNSNSQGFLPCTTLRHFILIPKRRSGWGYVTGVRVRLPVQAQCWGWCWVEQILQQEPRGCSVSWTPGTIRPKMPHVRPNDATCVPHLRCICIQVGGSVLRTLEGFTRCWYALCSSGGRSWETHSICAVSWAGHFPAPDRRGFRYVEEEAGADESMGDLSVISLGKNANPCAFFTQETSWNFFFAFRDEPHFSVWRQVMDAWPNPGLMN